MLNVWKLSAPFQVDIKRNGFTQKTSKQKLFNFSIHRNGKCILNRTRRVNRKPEPEKQKNLRTAMLEYAISSGTSLANLSKEPFKSFVQKMLAISFVKFLDSFENKFFAGIPYLTLKVFFFQQRNYSKKQSKRTQISFMVK